MFGINFLRKIIYTTKRITSKRLDFRMANLFVFLMKVFDLNFKTSDWLSSSQ